MSRNLPWTFGLSKSKTLMPSSTAFLKFSEIWLPLILSVSFVTSLILALFFCQMTYHFVENFKAVILVPFPGHLGQKLLRFLSFSEKVLKSRQIGFLKETGQMTVNRGFLEFFSIENIKKKIISKSQAIWVRLCILKPGFSKSQSLPVSGLKISGKCGPNDLIFFMVCTSRYELYFLRTEF
jgi:hypothetical protein